MSDEIQVTLLSDETIAEDGRRMTVENVTLWQTPLPLAASTVARTHKGLMEDDVYGSFLDGKDVSEGRRSSIPEPVKPVSYKSRGEAQSTWRKWVNCPPSPEESHSTMMPMAQRDLNQRPVDAVQNFNSSPNILDERDVTRQLFLANKENIGLIDNISPPCRLRPDSRTSLPRSSIESRESMGNQSDMSSLGIFDINDVSDFAASLSPQKPVSSKSLDRMKKLSPQLSDYEDEDEDEDENLTEGLMFAKNTENEGLQTVKRLSSQIPMMSVEVVEMPRYSNDSQVSGAVGDSMVSVEGHSQADSSGKTLLQTFIQASTTQDSFSQNPQTHPPKLKSCLKRPSLPRVEASPQGNNASIQDDQETHSSKRPSFQNGVSYYTYAVVEDDVPEKLQPTRESSENISAIPTTYTDTPYRDTPCLPTRSKPPVNKPAVPLNFGEMVFEGDSDDLDLSVADVQFGEDELQQFDEEFSDLEIDNTLTDEADSAPNTDAAEDEADNSALERAAEILERSEISLPLNGAAALEDVSSANDSGDSGNEGSLAASAHSSQTAMDVLRGLGFGQNQFDHSPLQEEKNESQSETQSEDFQESRHVRFASPMELRERDRNNSSGASLPDRMATMSDRMLAHHKVFSDRQMFEIADKSHDPLFDPSLTRISGDGTQDITQQEGEPSPWQQTEGRQESSGPSELSFNGAASLPFLSDSQSQTSSGSRGQSRFYASSSIQSASPAEMDANSNNSQQDKTPQPGPKNRSLSVQRSPEQFATSPGSDSASYGRVSLSDFMTPTLPEMNNEEPKAGSASSAVYMNEEGKYVTDLAYRTSFEESVRQQRNPFDTSMARDSYLFASGPNDNGETWGDPKDLPEISFDFNEDFEPAENKLDQFDADEVEFEAENKFREDEQMSQISLGLPDSWSLHSAFSGNVDASADYMRISIGTFMGNRTEALGNLGNVHNHSDERPNFGWKVTTPPSERPPVVLHQPSPGETDEQEVTPVAQKISVSLDLDDLDDTLKEPKSNVSKNSKSSTIDQKDRTWVNESANQSVFQDSRLSGNQKQDNRRSQELTNQDLLQGELGSSSGDDSSSLNISSIIRTAPSDMKSKDLANLIMRASQTKHRKSSAANSARASMERGPDSHLNAEDSVVSVKSEKSQRVSDSFTEGRDGDHVKVSQGKKSGPRSQATKENEVAKQKREKGRSSLPTKTTSTKRRESGHKRSSNPIDKVNTGRRSSTQSTGRSSVSSVRSSLDRSSRSSASRSSTGTKILKDSRKSSGERLSSLENDRSLSKIPVPRSSSGERKSPERRSLSRERSPLKKEVGERNVAPVPPHTPPSKLGNNSWSSPPPTTHLSQSQRKAESVRLNLFDKTTENNSLFGGKSAENTFQDDSVFIAKSLAGQTWQYGGLSLNNDSTMATMVNSVHSKSTTEQVQQQIREVAAKNLGLDSDVLKEVTPTNASSESHRKARHSSTPMLPGQQAHISIDTTTGSLSRISPDTPADQETVNSGEPVNPAVSAPVTVTRPERYVDHDHQSTPKKSGRIVSEPMQPRRLSPEDLEIPNTHLKPSQDKGPPEQLPKDSYQPIKSWKHCLLPDDVPTQPHTLPTLLSNISLTKTPFAQQYLHSNDSACVSRHSATLNMDSTGSTRYKSLPEPLFKPHRPHTEPLTSLDALQNKKYQRHSAEPVSHTSKDSRIYRQTTRPVESVPDEIRAGPVVLALKVPGELEIPEVCCVGLSCWAMLPIHNPTGRWLQACLELTALAVDGQAHNPSMVNPFHHRLKVIIEPQMTSEVKIIFTPRQPGAYIGELSVNVDVVSDQPYNGHCIPSVVTIQAVAEKPKIQVLADDGPILDFGGVAWGGSRSLPLTLINNGQAGVPLRLSVSSSRSAWQCFTFDRRTSGNSSVISRSSRSLSSVAPSVANYYLPPSDHDGQVHPLQILVHFKAPSRTSAKSLWQGPPEEYTAHIQIEVDTPNSLPLLEAVTLRAQVGTSRLHTPRDMDCIHLKTDKGSSCTHTLPLLNAGNIPLHLSLEITHWPDFFTVTPAELFIPPKRNIEVEIKFHPAQTQSAMKFDSLLLMFVQPDGPGYEIALIGEVAASAPKLAVSSNGPVLLSNKHFLSWGGVPLGKAKNQMFELKSIAKEEIQVKLQMPGNNRDFLFQNSSGIIERCSNSREIRIQPGEICPVQVTYCPTQIAASSSKIQVKMVNQKVKYILPLSGYGGTSKVIMEDPVQMTDPQGTEMNVGSLTFGCNIVKKVTLKNVGHRIAYIKAVAYEDELWKLPLDEPNVVIQPSKLCLAPNQSQTFAVLCQPSKQQVAMCSQQSSVFMVLKFFIGDEISRQLLVRSSEKTAQRYSPPDFNPAIDVNFKSEFQNERLMKELESMEGLKSSPTDIVDFYTSMESINVKFVGSPPPPPPVKPEIDGNRQSLTYNQLPGDTFAPLSILESSSFSRSRMEESVKSFVSSAGTGPLEITPQTGLSKKLNQRSNDRFLDVGDWEIQPQQIILTAPAPDAEPEIQLVQLINFSDRTLHYELSWPGHCVALTPERGVLPPRSHSILSVSANQSLRSRGISLPWSGVIHVTCDDQTRPDVREGRMIKVQIHDGQKLKIRPSLEPPPEPKLIDDSVRLMEVSTHGTPISSMNFGGGLKYNTQSLLFPATTVRTTAELHLELKNISKDPVKWAITEFAPPFMKENQSGDVRRLDYAAFWLPEKVGLMLPCEEKKVLVHFYPRLPGIYVQHWELKCKTEASLVAMSYTSKVEFSGEGVDVSRCSGKFHSTGNAEHPYQKTANLTQETMSRKSLLSSTLRSPAERLVAPKTWHLMFPQTSIGSKTECKLAIHNKDENQCHHMTVIEPDEPFSIRHHNIKVKPRCFVNVPVKFTPHVAGLHKKPLIMTSDLGKTFSVTLEGHAA